MPTYLLITPVSGCSPAATDNRDMTKAGEASSTLTISFVGSEVQNWGFITITSIPNSDAWETGDHTVNIILDATNMQISARIRILRINSACAIQDTGAFTASQDLRQNRVFTVTPTLTAQACGDRLVVEIEFTNGTTMNQSVGLAVGIAGECDDVSPITEDGGTCGAVAPGTSLSHPLINKSGVYDEHHDMFKRR